MNISWDDYFMSIAYLASLRSKDINTKVGACIVSQNNKILSTGYNGAPRKFNDNNVPPGNSGEWLNTKYPYVCHSELNALLNYGGSLLDLNNSKVYVTLFPCNECAKALAQAGIIEIIYMEDKHHDDDIYVASRKILDECGIIYRQHTIKDIKISLNN